MKAMLGLLGLILFATGCATTRSVDWASRIGVLTYDEAVLEMGVPERQATLSDGTIVAEWLKYRGGSYATDTIMPFSYRSYYFPRFYTYDVHRFPDRYIRLVFGPDMVLSRVEQVAR